MAVLGASVVVIGDEILGGFVHDTNSHWLAQRFTQLGIPLQRVQTVPDSYDAIEEAVTSELCRARPRLIVTSGGIGSTPDDVTLAAVARTLGRKLVTEPTIDTWITRAIEWTAENGGDVNDQYVAAMRRMAQVPDGAYLLASSDGVAPGIAVDVDGGIQNDGATVVVLPGVPDELQRIVDRSVIPTLLDGFGQPLTVIEITHEYPESMLNPVFDTLIAEFPDVHLGSYPGLPCTVRLKGDQERAASAATILRQAIAELDADPNNERFRVAWKKRFQ